MNISHSEIILYSMIFYSKSEMRIGVWFGKRISCSIQKPPWYVVTCLCHRHPRVGQRPKMYFDGEIPNLSSILYIFKFNCKLDCNQNSKAFLSSWNQDKEICVMASVKWTCKLCMCKFACQRQTRDVCKFEISLIILGKNSQCEKMPQNQVPKEVPS